MSVKLASHFLSPSLHSVVTFGHQLLVKEAVEKMNLMEEGKKNKNKKHCNQTVSAESINCVANRDMTT